MMLVATAKKVRIRARISLSLIAMTTVLLACAESQNQTEAAIGEWIAEIEVSVTEKARRSVVAKISADYGDLRGNEKDDIDKLLRFYFMRQNNIKLLTSIDRIELLGEGAAEVDLTVGLAGTSDGVLSFSADAYRFSLELQTEDDEWRLVAARWGEVGQELR